MDSTILSLLSKRTYLWRNRNGANEHCEKINKQIDLLKERKPQGPEIHFDLRTHQTRLAQTTLEVQRYDKDLAKLDKSLQGPFLSKLARFDQIEQKLEAFEAQLRQRDDDKGGQIRQERLEKRIADIEQNATRDNEYFTKRLESAARQAKQVLAENSKLKTQVNILEKKLEESSKVASRVSDLEKKLEENAGLASRLADLEKKFEDANNKPPPRTQELDMKPSNHDRLALDTFSGASSPAHGPSIEQIRHMVEAHDRQLNELATRGPLYSPAPAREDPQSVYKMEFFSSLCKDLMSDVGAHKHRIERLEIDMRNRPEPHQSPVLFSPARPRIDEDVIANIRTQVYTLLNGPGGALDAQGQRLKQVEAQVSELQKSKAKDYASDSQSDLIRLKHRFDEGNDLPGNYQRLWLQIESMKEWQNNFHLATFKREIANDVKSMLLQQPQRNGGASPNEHTALAPETSFASIPPDADLVAAKKRKIQNGQGVPVSSFVQHTNPSNGFSGHQDSAGK